GCCFRQRPAGCGGESRRAYGATRRTGSASGERLLEGTGRATPRSRLGQPALELVTPPPPRLSPPGRAPPERGCFLDFVEILVVVGEVLQRLAPAGKLLGKLVEFLFGHGPELPELALQHPARLLAGARRIEEGQPRTEDRAPEQPLGGRIGATLDVHHLAILLATYHPLLLFPGVRIVLGRDQRRLERRVVLDRGLNEAMDVLLGTVDVQLLEQERERALQVRGDRRADLPVQRPEVALEGADRLFPCLVVELLRGVSAL